LFSLGVGEFTGEAGGVEGLAGFFGGFSEVVEEGAMLIVDAMEKRKRLVIGSMRGKLGRWVKLIAPKVIDNIAKKAIAAGK